MPLNSLRPVHPGEILREDFLPELRLKPGALAIALKVDRRRIKQILAGRRRINANIALRLAHYFGGDAQSWLNLQLTYDLKIVEKRAGNRIAREVQPREEIV